MAKVYTYTCSYKPVAAARPMPRMNPAMQPASVARIFSIGLRMGAVLAASGSINNRSPPGQRKRRNCGASDSRDARSATSRIVSSDRLHSSSPQSPPWFWPRSMKVSGWPPVNKKMNCALSGRPNGHEHDSLMHVVFTSKNCAARIVRSPWHTQPIPLMRSGWKGD